MINKGKMKTTKLVTLPPSKMFRVEPWSNDRRSVAVLLTENRGFITIVLLIATVAGWGDSDMLSEDLGQVCLAREAAIRSNVNNVHFPPFQ